MMRSPFLLLLASTTFAQQQPFTFVEKNGVVSMEAEHFTDNIGAWMEVEGRNANETNRGISPDYRLHVVDAKHSLTAGLAGEIKMPRNTWVAWGYPAPSATVAIRLGHEASKAAVFGFEKGSSMADGTKAPARRVFVPMPTPTVPELSQLAKAAVQWAADGAATKRALLIIEEPEPTPAEVDLKKAIEQAGFSVTQVVSAEAKPEHASGQSVLVVPVSLRYEKIKDKFNTLTLPVVVAGKGEMATELGMTLPPRVTPDGGNAMLINEGTWTDHLRYSIHFKQPGDYNVWLLAQSGGSAGSDEAKIFFNRKPDVKADDFFEMQMRPELDWVGRATARRPENRKTPVPARVTVPKPGWYDFYIVRGSEPDHHTPEPPPEYRYYNWRIDKVVLMKTDSFRPNGDGPEETLNDGNLQPPKDMLTQNEWRPKQIWRMREGIAVIEAEKIDHHPHWVDKDGYIEWAGHQWSRSIEGLGGNDDYLHVRQGAPEHWLILRVMVDEPGAYRLDVRNRHAKADGDNDCWVGYMGQRATRTNPIKRLGDSHRDGKDFTWLDWGVPTFQFKKGLNEVYVGGRSKGFGIDRVVLYKDADEAAKARALSEDAPRAELVR
jgi:hypothetical protein